jgi:hypothetical protein
MTFENKKEKAIQILQERQMWRTNAIPPLLRFLWWCGLKIPPFPFASFWQIFLLMSVMFAVLWGGAMWLFSWHREGMQFYFAVKLSIITGCGFGFFMACYHRISKYLNRIPNWKDL